MKFIKAALLTGIVTCGLLTSTASAASTIAKWHANCDGTISLTNLLKRKATFVVVSSTGSTTTPTQYYRERAVLTAGQEKSVGIHQRAVTYTVFQRIDNGQGLKKLGYGNFSNCN